MTKGTFFITSRTQTPIFQNKQSAELFLDVLQSYRRQHKFLLHAFVVMPDHFHVMLTPAEALTVERSVQYIKGGFSFRAKKELAIQGEVWQPKYHDRRIRDAEECAALLHYLEENPLKRRLAQIPSEFPFSSANPRFSEQVDELPNRFKMSDPSASRRVALVIPRAEARGLPKAREP